MWRMETPAVCVHVSIHYILIVLFRVSGKTKKYSYDANNVYYFQIIGFVLEEIYSYGWLRMKLLCV